MDISRGAFARLRSYLPTKPVAIVPTVAATIVDVWTILILFPERGVCRIRETMDVDALELKELRLASKVVNSRTFFWLDRLHRNLAWH